MSLETRRRAIIELVTEQGDISIQALAAHFQVSVQTLRSDLRYLTEQRLLLRRHGVVAPFARENVAYQQREIVNIQGKQLIGQQTAHLLADADSCFLGTGTTIEMVARALPKHSKLSIFTNNFHALPYIGQLVNCQLTVAGGRIRLRDLDIIGSDAQLFFSRYRVDVGVVSVGGISDTGELYDFNDDEVVARQVLLANACIKILVIDSTKFNRQALCCNGDINDFDYVVSDRAPSALQQARLLRGRTQWQCQESLASPLCHHQAALRGPDKSR